MTVLLEGNYLFVSTLASILGLSATELNCAFFLLILPSTAILVVAIFTYKYIWKPNQVI